MCESVPTGYCIVNLCVPADRVLQIFCICTDRVVYIYIYTTPCLSVTKGVLNFQVTSQELSSYAVAVFSYQVVKRYRIQRWGLKPASYLY